MKVDQRRPLGAQDSERQTFGCRHATPDNCRNNATPGKCAFVRGDNICLLPPRCWSRLSEQLFRVDKWSVCRG